MKRLLAIAIALYVPHLVEEALTHMHDDPIIVFAYAPLASLSPRHAAYLVFQVMLATTLVTALLFGMGGRARLFVMAAIGLALLAEGHHMIRALYTLHYDSGLVTSLFMPFFGAYVLRRVFQETKTCSTSSSSPWVSAASSSGSCRSSPQVRARA